MPLTGDFGKVAQWIDRIGNIESPSVRAQASAEMAEATRGFIAGQFETSSDPFGNPWAPKKVFDGRPVGTGKTGRLKRYRVRSASASGFSVYSPTAPYRKFFHGGTRHMKARRISPGTIIPRRWSSAYQGIWSRFCTQKLRGF